jgi:hypothetical protein
VPAARSTAASGRHTGLSVLLAVLVVVLAGLVLVVLNAVFGTLMV